MMLLQVEIPAVCQVTGKADRKNRSGKSTARSAQT